MDVVPIPSPSDFNTHDGRTSAQLKNDLILSRFALSFAIVFVDDDYFML